MNGDNAKRRRRGEPVLALGVLALVWIAVRAAAWQSPFAGSAETGHATPLFAQSRARAPQPERRPFAEPTPSVRIARAPSVSPPVTPALAMRIARPAKQRVATAPAFVPTAPLVHPPADLSPARPAPLAGVGYVTSAKLVSPPAGRLGRVDTRKPWRVDTWFAWRSGSRGGAPAQARSLLPTYGASQAGLLARTDLGQGSRRPQAYARLLHAPDAPRQSEAAIGLSARPIGSLPVRLQIEARATRWAGSIAARPAILAVSELPPIDLPLDLAVEGYGQAGWVGGRFATPFADGQLRLARQVLATGPARLQVGAGSWGGAQRGASRLDVGPTATMDLRDGPFPARISVDYRQRIAGQASPGSGVAVTVSTGF